MQTGVRGERDDIVERLKMFFNIEVDAVTFHRLFPNPNGLAYFCEQNNIVHHPNPTTGGFTFWDKSKLEEAEAEMKEDEESMRKMREANAERLVEEEI